MMENLRCAVAKSGIQLDYKISSTILLCASTDQEGGKARKHEGTKDGRKERKEGRKGRKVQQLRVQMN